MLTSRETVIKCLNFLSTDRIPRDLWTQPYITLFQEEEYKNLLKEYPMDIDATGINPYVDNVGQEARKKGGKYMDEWGSIWYVGEPGVLGEVKKPVLDNWSKLKKIKPPYHIIKNRNISHINRICEKSKKFVISDVAARPFERLQFLRGTENLFIDIAYGVSELQKLIEILHEFNIKDIESWCKTEVDGILFMDDWGSNNSLLINPKIWKEIFKPLYKEYCEIIHGNGKYAFFHCDGFIEPIFADLVELSIDAINSQLFTMNIEKLGEKFKGKITIWGEIDRQYLLPFGSKEEIYKAVIRVKEAFYTGNSGIIAQCEWGKNNPIENIKAVYDAWGEI